MQQQLSYRTFRWWMASLALLLALALYPPFRSHAQQKQQAKAKQQQDTTGRKPVTYGHTHKTYEALAEELAGAARQLEAEMKRLQESELPKMQAGMQKALKEMDAAKWKAEIDQSMAQVDWAAVDVEKLRQEMKAWQTKLAASLEKEMVQARREMEKNSLHLEETMQEARRQMQAAQEEIQRVNKGIDELITDGIVKKDEAAEIEWDGDVLVVNGKRQSAAVSKKYAAYFRKGTSGIQTTPPPNRQ